jgi:hexosaminidase
MRPEVDASMGASPASSKRRIARGLLAVVLAGGTCAAYPWDAVVAQQAAATSDAAAVVASADKLKLRWGLAPRAPGAQPPGGRTPARLTLTNGDARALPAQGWALYFNCMDGVSTGALPGELVLEQVAANLYRLRPTPGFAGLAPGAALDIDYFYPWAVTKLAKAPAGPYLVYDAAPEVGTAIGDYALLPVTGPALVTPQDTYRANLAAELLPASAVPPVLPTPLFLEQGAGRLALRARPRVIAPPALAREAALAASLFAAVAPSASGDASKAAGPPLRLSVGAVPGQSSPEAYRLRIRADSGIDIVGNSAAGVFYGLQTLRDLMPLPDSRDAAQATLRETTIVDAPRFGYRGFQLDVARNFHGKEVVFKWLDLMARYKLNTLHLHLSDDEGWRLEIAGLPELTSIGAVRGHAATPGLRLQPAYGSGPDLRDPHGSGYYTRADYIAILRYAAARHIEVIPEIEMPGHARAAVLAMRARYQRLQAAGDRDAARYLLDDPQDRSVYRSAQMYTDNVMNPGLDSTYAFIERVLGEVAAMHRAAGVPLRTVHVGGDELPNGAWEASPASLARMRKEGLASTIDLWDYFYGRVDAMLRAQGLFASGWEELAARKTVVDGRPKLIPNPKFIGRGFQAWVWNDTPGAEDFAYRLANAGYDIVLAPVTAMYMDQSANANLDEPGVNWGATIELRDVYDFTPLDMLKNAAPAARFGKEGLSDAGRARVRGLEATLFTETVRDPARIDYLVMPRLLAVAERAWAPDPAWARAPDPAMAEAQQRAAWSGFVNELGRRVLPSTV